MLKCKQTEEGKPSYILGRGINAEDATLFAEARGHPIRLPLRGVREEV
jgi:hypothetical protein